MIDSIKNLLNEQNIYDDHHKFINSSIIIDWKVSIDDQNLLKIEKVQKSQKRAFSSFLVYSENSRDPPPDLYAVNPTLSPKNGTTVTIFGPSVFVIFCTIEIYKFQWIDVNEFINSIQSKHKS
jgi:hypothetical protein